MKAFASLFNALDSTTSTSAKTAALADYLGTVPDRDRLWLLALLTGRRPRRIATSTELRQWALQLTGLPDWLFEESYALAGDLAETISAILPAAPAEAEVPRLAEVLDGLARLSGQPIETRREAILAAWGHLPATERFLFTKLLTGGFRMGVSRGLITRALARATDRPEVELAQSLMGDWTPASTDFATLIEGGAGSAANPFPFALASPLEAAPETLGPPGDWLAEWKWDGIRAQLVSRPGAFALWSRGEELITDRFPELAPLADFLPPGTVVDGELLVWDAEATRPKPFALLQKRITRNTVTKALLKEAPAFLLAYDLLEAEGEDLRGQPLSTRRARLEALAAHLPAGLPFGLSPLIPFEDWPELAMTRDQARDHLAEGLMLKRATSPWFAGRKRGDWWKWKLDPMSVDAVMIYAQAGHGRRAALYTDYTFAVRDGDALVPFTKAYSGLTDAEFAQITSWVNRHTLERFGPVRRVPPELVFEIGFEGIQASPRHKSGIALRFPRILRWRQDKPVAEIDTIETLRTLLAEAGGQPPDPRDI